MSRNFFLYYASLVLKKVENTGLESNRNSFNLIFLHKNCIILLEFFFSVIKVDNYFNCSKYNISEWIKWVFQLYVTIETYGLWEKGTIYLECTNYVFVTHFVVINYSFYFAGYFICPSCGKTYKTKGSLSSHRSKDCGKPKSYECLYCHRPFKRKASLKNHVLCTHERRGIF